MRKNRLAIVLLILILITSAIGLYTVITVTGKLDVKDKIYVVAKTTNETVDFWMSIASGAEVAAKEFDVDVEFVGPLREIDVQDQIDIVRSLIDKKPLAIVLAASDYEALAEVSQEVVKSGITLVTIDSEVNITEKHSFIATNNVQASERLAFEMGSLIKGTGQVAIIAHVEGASTTFEREEGFRKGLSSYDNLSVLDEVWYSNNEVETAYEETKQIVSQYPHLKGIFGTNEGTLIGIAKAIQELGKEKEVVVVGFDFGKDAFQYVESGVIRAVIVQRPFNMGYLGVKEAIEQARTRIDTRQIDTGAVLINKENMFLPENQKLLVPFVTN